MLPIIKDKDVQECGNYRGIKLMSCQDEYLGKSNRFCAKILVIGFGHLAIVYVLGNCMVYVWRADTIFITSGMGVNSPVSIFVNYKYPCETEKVFSIKIYFVQILK